LTQSVETTTVWMAVKVPDLGQSTARSAFFNLRDQAGREKGSRSAAWSVWAYRHFVFLVK
jgi:hypothetical protein